MPIAEIRAYNTIYEVDKSENKRFYAVEKAGFTDVGALTRDVITRMINYQWFTVIHTKITDKNNFVMTTPEWPPTERLIEMANKGIGYTVNNVLEFPLSIQPNIKLKVTEVDKATGNISNVSVIWPGNYFSSVATANVPSQGYYAANLSTPIVTGNVTTKYESYAEARQIWGNTTNTTGSVLPDQSPAATLSESDSQDWTTNYGSLNKTSGPYGEPVPPKGGAKGRKTQATGIWFTVPSPNIGGNVP